MPKVQIVDQNSSASDGAKCQLLKLICLIRPRGRERAPHAAISCPPNLVSKIKKPLAFIQTVTARAMCVCVRAVIFKQRSDAFHAPVGMQSALRSHVYDGAHTFTATTAQVGLGRFLCAHKKSAACPTCLLHTHNNASLKLLGYYVLQQNRIITAAAVPTLFA